MTVSLEIFHPCQVYCILVMPSIPTPSLPLVLFSFFGFLHLISSSLFYYCMWSLVLLYILHDPGLISVCQCVTVFSVHGLELTLILTGSLETCLLAESTGWLTRAHAGNARTALLLLDWFFGSLGCIGQMSPESLELFPVHGSLELTLVLTGC